MLLWIIRVLLSFALGLVVFLALAVLLLSMGAGKLLSGDLYAKVLEDRNVYERVYVEVLTPQAMEKVRPRLDDPLTLLTGEELVELTRAVAPPEYLKGQVEANLDLVDIFFAGESDSLAIYVDLARPLDRIGPAIAGVVEPRIYGEPGQAARSSSRRIYRPPTVRSLDSPTEEPHLTKYDYASEIEAAMESVLTGGAVSTTISELTGLTQGEALEVFDRSADAILVNERVNPQYRESLRDARPTLREAFTSGTTHDLLSTAIEAAAKPALDLVLADTRAMLDEEGQLNLVPPLAEDFLGKSEPELQASLRASRDSIEDLLFWGRALPVLAIALAVALAAVVFWGRRRAFYRWLYLTLIMSGGALFAITLVAYFTVPAGVERAVVEVLEGTVEVLPGLPFLMSDVAAAIASEQLGRLVWLSAVPAVAGAGLWVAGWLAGRYGLSNMDQMPGENQREGPTPSH